MTLTSSNRVRVSQLRDISVKYHKYVLIPVDRISCSCHISNNYIYIAVDVVILALFIASLFPFSYLLLYFTYRIWFPFVLMFMSCFHSFLPIIHLFSFFSVRFYLSSYRVFVCLLVCFYLASDMNELSYNC